MVIFHAAPSGPAEGVGPASRRRPPLQGVGERRPAVRVQPGGDDRLFQRQNARADLAVGQVQEYPVQDGAAEPDFPGPAPGFEGQAPDFEGRIREARRLVFPVDGEVDACVGLGCCQGQRQGVPEVRGVGRDIEVAGLR
jgi:hypothetical protein